MFKIAQDSTRVLTEHEYVNRIERKFTNALQYNEKNFKRNIDNWHFYWALDAEKGLGQWPAGAVTDMIREGRHLATYNLCSPVVDNIAGGMLKAGFSFDYSPVDSDLNTLTYKSKDLFRIDREMCDWRQHELPFVIGGLVFESVMEMYVNRDYNKKLGNIGMRTLLPGSVIFDPKWKTNRSKDCTEAFKTSWLTPAQMLDYYADHKDQIINAVMTKAFGENALKALAEYYAQYGDEYGENLGPYPYPYRDDMWGNSYRVIEYYHMEKVSHTVEYVLTENEDKVIIPADLKTPENKLAWLNENVPGWVPDQIWSEEVEEDIQYVTTVCPALSRTFLLANGPTEIQCGRLQFFPWSARRINGEVGGIVDAIKDAQMTVNYWESLITHKIQTEGGGGAQLVDPDAFESRSEYERYVKQRNNPKAVFRMKRGYLRNFPNGPAVPVTKSPFPAEAMQHLTHMIEMMMPKLSRVNPAAQGRSEASNESGYLYQLKKMQNDIEQYVIYEGYRNIWNEIAEAYLFEAAHIYGNGIPRKFYDPRTKKTTTINERVTRQDEKGNWIEGILNDMSKLREIRHRVIITEAEDSPSRKVEIMQVANSVLQVTPPERTLTRGAISHILAKQIDAFSEDQKTELDHFYEIEQQMAIQQLKTNIATLQAQEKQATNPPPPAPPPGGPGPGGQSVPPQEGPTAQNTIPEPPMQGGAPGTIAANQPAMAMS